MWAANHPQKPAMFSSWSFIHGNVLKLGNGVLAGGVRTYM